MTIDMSTTRTDLALESVQAACSGAETGTISGVRSRERTREGYAVTDIRVEDEDGAQALGKPVGRYVTVDLGPYFRREADYFDRGVRCLAGELAALLPEGPVLAAGLGNRAMTCDAVGPASIDNLLVTRHMIRAMPRQFADFRPVAAVCPGVLARAGLFLTPRDIDQRIRELGRLLGYGITLALQPSLTAADVTALLG